MLPCIGQAVFTNKTNMITKSDTIPKTDIKVKEMDWLKHLS